MIDERERAIRNAKIASQDDLIALLEVLNDGHNITRSDAYALLNHIESLASPTGNLRSPVGIQGTSPPSTRDGLIA